MWWWKHFKPYEVLSPTGLREYEKGNLMFQPWALDAFDEFRSFLKSPLYANHGYLKHRGYRSPKENSKVGGAALSRHVQGIALDLTSDDLTPHELFSKAKDNAEAFGFGGLGLYSASRFVHIDCRPLLNDRPITWGK